MANKTPKLNYIKGRPKPWMVRYYDCEKRKSKGFKTKSDAETFMKQLPSNIVETVTGKTMLIPEQDRHEFILASQLVKEKGLSITKLTAFIKENLPQLSQFSEMPISEATDKFIKNLERLNKRLPTIEEHKMHLKHLCTLGRVNTIDKKIKSSLIVLYANKCRAIRVD